MDVDLSDHFTMGAAFTANYGDLTASAADSADGHLDSYYANLFGRYQSKRWAHTLILTGGVERRQAQPHGQLRSGQLQDAGQHQRVGLWSDV